MFIKKHAICRRLSAGLIIAIAIATTLLRPICSQAQQKTVGGIQTLIQSVQERMENFPFEKLHLQMDKPWYYAGDTVWFKGYLFDAAYLSASTKSGLLYVEIADDTNRLIKRISIPVNSGLTWGNIALDSKIPAGSYTLKAYSSWMLNAGEEKIYKKRFYVNDVTAKPLLITLRSTLTDSAARQFTEINLGIRNSNNQVIGSNPFQLRILEAGRSLERSNMVSDVNGNIAFRFPLPKRSLRGDLTITLENRQKNAVAEKLYVPLQIDRPEFIDLQFLPESGALIAGIPTQVGVKCLGENGLSKNITGIIIDQAGEKITDFHTLHKGMGAFSFTPVAGKVYQALVNTSTGQKTWPLPLMRQKGTVLHITNDPKSDSIQVDIFRTEDFAAAMPSVMLLGLSRNFPCWGANLVLKNAHTKISIAKKVFPDGIAKFSLLSGDLQTLNERMIFLRRRQSELNLKIDFSKTSYSLRDSIGAEIFISDQAGQPVQASLSISVTDNAQVAAEGNNEASIVSSLLLSSDLKGVIEEPGYYFNEDPDGSIARNLDYLMLTQGWSGFNLIDLRKQPSPKYAAETFFGVRGRVLNIFNKPVKNTNVVLLSKKPGFIIDTKTNDSGVFVFADLPPADTASFLLQARNPKGKSFNVGIEVNEFKAPVISNPSLRALPWYVNIDTARYTALARNTKILDRKAEITGRSQMLQEVIVVGKKVIRDSKNLNGPGESDFAMNAAELEKAGKITLGTLIEKNIEGFHIGGKLERIFMVNNMALHLIIDGITVDRFQPEGMSVYEFYRTFFDYYTAEDIKGLELMKSGKYQMSYTREYIPDPLAKYYEHVFLEVTTFGGTGPFLHKLPGVYLYKPLPLTLPDKFYAPKYLPDSSLNPPPGTDTRSTIHWEPNLITDTTGRAKLSFFSADYPGTYSVIIECSNMDGLIGIIRKTIIIK